jgi:hypothetical protein
MALISLYNNPLYGNLILSWKIIYRIDAVVKGITFAFLFFFLLVLFDNFRIKNHETNLLFFLHKAIFGSLFGILLIFEGLFRVELNIVDAKYVE